MPTHGTRIGHWRTAGAAFACLTLLTTGCVRDAFFEYRVQEGCWDMDPSPPEGVGVADCRNTDDGIMYLIDPQGDCWQVPVCDVPASWEGWRYADQDEDAWCLDAAARQWELECEA